MQICFNTFLKYDLNNCTFITALTSLTPHLGGDSSQMTQSMYHAGHNRRRTDLMPAITPIRHFTSASSSGASPARTPTSSSGRTASMSMSRLDLLARPRSALMHDTKPKQPQHPMHKYQRKSSNTNKGMSVSMVALNSPPQPKTNVVTAPKRPQKLNVGKKPHAPSGGKKRLEKSVLDSLMIHFWWWWFNTVEKCLPFLHSI